MKVLLVFAVLIGLTIAEDSVKNSLLKRTQSAGLELNFASNRFKAHGFDYFSEILENVLAEVQYVRTQVGKLPNDATEANAESWINEMKHIEQRLPQLIQFPAIREIYKAGALYYAVIKLSHNETSAPTPDNLKKQVADIVAEENLIQGLINAPNQAERQMKAQHLNAQYDVLLNNIKGTGIPTQDTFDKLESEAKSQIVKYQQAGQADEAKKVQEVLDRFLTSTFYIAKYFPLDRQTRLNQFLKAAPAHYKAYQALNALILL